MADSLDALTAEPTVWRMPDGREVRISPLKVRQIGPFTRAITPLLPMLEPVDGGMDLVPLMAAHAERVIDAVAIATGETSEWVESLDLDVLAQLIEIVVEVNADFFVRRLMPVLMSQAAKIKALQAGLTGLMPQPS